MALSGAQITRIGIIGFPGRAYSGFTAKSPSAIVVIPGLEYSLLENKLHYSMDENKIEYEIPENRLHYSETD